MSENAFGNRLGRNVFGLVFSLYVLTIVIRFFRVLITHVANPFAGGLDWIWFIAWLSASVASILLTAVVPARRKIAVSLVPAGIAGLVLTLSHSWVPMLIGLWVLSGCLGLGVVAMRVLVGNWQSTIDYVTCGIPLGIGGVSLIVFGAGLLGYVTVAAVLLLLCGLSALNVILWRKAWPAAKSLFTRSKPISPSSEDALIYVLLSCLAVVYSTWAIAPEIQYDALNYHLAVPKMYLENSSLTHAPFFHAYFARLIEMFFTVPLALGGAPAVKLCILLVSLGATIAVYALGRSVFEHSVGLWAAALFFTTPFVGWLSGTAYVENLIAFIITSSFIALTRWGSSQSCRWLYVAALLSGFAVGAKISSTFVYLLPGPVIAFEVLRNKNANLIRNVRTLAAAVLAFAVAALPTYALTYATTKNPVFPLLNSVFASPMWNTENVIMNASDFGFPKTAPQLIRFPFRLTFDTIRFSEVAPRGSLGLALLFAFPFSFGLWRRARMPARLLILGAFGHLVALFFTMQYARYVVAVLPLIAVLGAGTILHLSPSIGRRWSRICLLLIVVMQPLVYSLQYLKPPERLPVSLALGRESREAFLTRSLRGYAAARYLNSVTNAGDRILGVDTEGLRFYLRAQLETVSLALWDDPVRSLTTMTDNDVLLMNMRRLGINYLFVMRSAIRNDRDAIPYLEAGFLKAHTVSLFQDEYALVYQLK